MKRKTVLVTGYRGFIGRNLIKAIPEKDLILYVGDIKEKISSDKKIDCVVHLAAKTDSRESQKIPGEYYTVNVLGTINILEFCRRTGAKLVFTSTGQVCGHKENSPIDEDTQKNPINPYTKSKAISEDLCKYYNEDFKIKATLLRLFNVYGPGQKENFIVPYIIRPLIEDKEVRLNRPDVKRDFIYIDDVIDSIRLAIDYSRNDFDIFNIGSGVSTSIEDIIKVVESKIGKKGRVTYTYQRPEAQEIYADISKARRLLGFNPKISLEDGISRMCSLVLSQR